MSILYYLEQENYSNKSIGIKSLNFLPPINNSFKIIKIQNIEKDDVFTYINTLTEIQQLLIIKKYHTFSDKDFNDNIEHDTDIQLQYNKQTPIKISIFKGVVYNFTLNKLNNFKSSSNNNFPKSVITDDLKKYIFKESKYKMIVKFRKINRIIYPKTSIPTNTRLTKRI